MTNSADQNNAKNSPAAKAPTQALPRDPHELDEADLDDVAGGGARLGAKLGRSKTNP